MVMSIIALAPVEFMLCPLAVLKPAFGLVAAARDRCEKTIARVAVLKLMLTVGDRPGINTRSSLSHTDVYVPLHTLNH